MTNLRSILGIDEPGLSPYLEALHRLLALDDTSHPLLESALQLQLDLIRHEPEAYYDLCARPEFIGATLLPARASFLLMHDDIEISAQQVAFLLNPAKPSLDRVERLTREGRFTPVGNGRPSRFRLGDVRRTIDTSSPEETVQ